MGAGEAFQLWMLLCLEGHQQQSRRMWSADGSGFRQLQMWNRVVSVGKMEVDEDKFSRESFSVPRTEEKRPQTASGLQQPTVF